MKRILFITWDGPQTTYLKGLFLPIFIELKKYGYEFYIIQFSWNDKKYIDDINAYCDKFSINYKHIKVLRKPSVSIGSLITSFVGSFKIKSWIKKWEIDIVIPRSTMPSLSLLLAKRKKDKFKVIFDADGLPLDERIDFNSVNPLSLSYNFLKLVELRMSMKADQVLVRSEKAKEILFNRVGSGFNIGKFNLVSNGRNSDLFKISNNRSDIRKKLNINVNDILITYVGSLAPQYCIEEMLYFFSKIKEKFTSAKFLVLSGNHHYFLQKLKKYEELRKDIILKSLESKDVGKYLSSCDLGLAIRRKSFSMQAVAPIKLGEYLMCGLPVIATSEIGDTYMINNNNGYLLHNNSKEEIDLALEWFHSNYLKLRKNSKDIEAIGKNYFSLDSSVKKYLDVLRKI